MIVKVSVDSLSPIMTQCYTVPGTQNINLDPVSHLKMNFIVHRKNSKKHCIEWDKIVTSVKTAKQHI